MVYLHFPAKLILNLTKVVNDQIDERYFSLKVGLRGIGICTKSDIYFSIGSFFPELID